MSNVYVNNLVCCLVLIFLSRTLLCGH